MEAPHTSRVSASGLERLQQQVAELVDAGLYDSAEALGSFLVSGAAAAASGGAGAGPAHLVLLADALVGRREHRRALVHYRQALQLARITQKEAGKADAQQSLSSGGPAEADVKFKLARCHLALKETRVALAELETIPARARTLPISLTLAHLYNHTGYERAAIACFKECLQICPFALEALTALSQLGVPADELRTLLPVPSTAVDDIDPNGWLWRLAVGHAAAARHDHAVAVEHFDALSNIFPDNLHLLIASANADANRGKSQDAIAKFQKARLVDAYNMSAMDVYAMLVKQSGDGVELNRLTHELLNVDARRPEAWAAATLYWEFRGDRLRALQYTEKAVRLDERHVMSHLLKGNLSLALKRPDASVASFRKAQSLMPSLPAYQGLVKAYLAQGKYKEAAAAAKEALKLMPNCARALTLLGDVHAQQPDGHDKALKLYEMALRVEPDCTDAAMSLVDLHAGSGALDQAIALLQHHLTTAASADATLMARFHHKLATVLVASKKFTDATGHYQAALSLNVHLDESRRGLERVEKLMKGVDPDAVEEEDEDEEEDDDGDEADGDESDIAE